MDVTFSHPPLTLVAAVARNGIIGRAGGLAWSHPADLARFRTLTQGHTVLMGRKTWDSLPPRFRPLPGRRNVVISRQAGLVLPGAEVFASLADALQALHGGGRVYVIGGGEIYKQALPLADELALTEVDAVIEGDTLFPGWERQAWQEAAREQPALAEGAPAAPAFCFVHYKRRGAAGG